VQQIVHWNQPSDSLVEREKVSAARSQLRIRFINKQTTDRKRVEDSIIITIITMIIITCPVPHLSISKAAEIPMPRPRIARCVVWSV
jgi:hypothetical protein